MAKQYKICQTCGSKVLAEKKEVRYIWRSVVTNGLHFCHKGCPYLYPHGKKGYRCAFEIEDDLFVEKDGRIRRLYKCECSEINKPY